MQFWFISNGILLPTNQPTKAVDTRYSEFVGPRGSTSVSHEHLNYVYIKINN